MGMQLEKSTRTPAASATVVPNEELINVSVMRTKAQLDTERRNAMIAEAAYYRAERRGFESGFELEDWLEAEAEIDGLFKDGEIPLACGI
jgi:hypothetical protein